jgi:hypothetical protein
MTMNETQSPASEAPALAICQHENFHVNATGTSHNEDDTVTIRTHYWCDDCQTGFHHDGTMPAAEYWRMVREED